MITTRTYGTGGRTVVVVHGGPGAPGSAAPLARALGRRFRVLEPLQRPSGGEPLSVARHVADLDEVVRRLCGDERPGVVGHSWGAMLALAFAARHPDSVAALVLVASGTFDPLSRARLAATRAARLDADLRQALARLDARVEPSVDPAEVAEQRRTLERLARLDSFDPLPEDETWTDVAYDARGNAETWADMLRLQEAGVYPQAFARIVAPVLMLHGSFDPHPGRMIRDSLRPFVPQLDYHEWEACGHYPWRERAVREDFLARLEDWLQARCQVLH